MRAREAVRRAGGQGFVNFLGEISVWEMNVGRRVQKKGKKTYRCIDKNRFNRVRGVFSFVANTTFFLSPQFYQF